MAHGTSYLKRILYFSRDYTTHDHRFLSALARTDHDVFYMRLESGNIQLEDRPIPEGIEPITWAGGRETVRVDDLQNLVPALNVAIQQVKPDLIHAGPIQRSAYLVALCGFQPLVSVSWGYDLIIDANRNSEWERITRFTLEHSTTMIGDCNTIRQLAISYGMPDERIVTFPWGIDLELFSPTDVTTVPDEQTFTLLSTRGWEPVYGVDVIARAFVKAARKRPGLRLVMLGGGSQASLLERIFESGGVSEQVQFPGQISQDELPDIYRSADLYISASHSDGTSISLLEALASGCPVLASDIPGNQEWITPGVQGWLFPDADDNSLAQGILHAVEQRDQLPRMSRSARALAEQRANWNVNFQQLLHAYKMTLHHSAASQ